MGTYRTTILIGSLSAILAVAAPSCALASSLLSGYGGPGEGNQALLGSALINGPRGGSSGGASGSSSSGSRTSSAGGSASSGAAGAGAGAQGESAAGRNGSAATGTTRHGAAASGARPTASASLYPAAERIPPGVSNGTLGISAGDLALIVIGFAALASIGALTAWLTRPMNVAAGDGSLKVNGR